jgi:hypothetical protein
MFLLLFNVCNDGIKKWKLRLRVFGNRVLRRIFGPKREEVAGSREELHHKDLHNLYSQRNIVRVITSHEMGRDL